MSQQNRISITRALSELGMINSRIAMAISAGTFIALVRGDAQKPAVGAFANIGDLKTHMQASFDSVDGLIKRQEKLKAAVIKSNSTTMVTIAGKTMSIAEAIDQKKVAAHKQSFLQTLKRQMSGALNEFNVSTEKLDQQIERQLQAIYSVGKEKVTQDQYATIANPLKKEYAPHIVSFQEDLNGYIRQFEKELNDFLDECDYVLSESNSQTIIEI